MRNNRANASAFASGFRPNRTFALTLLTLLLWAGLLPSTSRAEDGYRLWLRYDRIEDPQLLQQYRSAILGVLYNNESSTLHVAVKELRNGLDGLLGQQISFMHNALGWAGRGALIIGTPASSPFIARLHWTDSLNRLGDEGFMIRLYTLNDQSGIAIVANTDIGVLYGVFHFLRLLQTHQSLQSLDITSIPALRYRVLDHWDNLNRTVERGYAGLSIFDWWTLPLYKDSRYTDYARANASVGINGLVLNSVNASPIILTPAWLAKAAALADIFRPYGIRVYLSVNFSSPITIGGLPTADPLDTAVQSWWKKTANEIYSYIPDFGGFLVKANSEGQPGPQNYRRSHADGANTLADALAPHHGIVIWRAFVYSESSEDRVKQAYDEFKPLDGKFRNNVLLQVKNGPLDFQPREPFSPLFGAIPKTPLMLEVQITQEYLGFSNHLVYLAPLFEECLNADTYTKGKGTPVSSTITGMAGVANIGNDINWCGHPFAQANWYAFGRLAWSAGTKSVNPASSTNRVAPVTNPAGQATPTDLSALIAGEWIRQTFSNNPGVVDTLKKMMLASREITVDYMTPLGLAHIMGYSHHYGPAPWYDKASRADWNPVYFHRADSAGLGFDRTVTGSNALEQYAPGARAQWGDKNDCPDNSILWWHHVGWNDRLHSGRTLWEELCYKYYTGVDSVRWMQKCWDALQPGVASNSGASPQPGVAPSPRVTPNPGAASKSGATPQSGGIDNQRWQQVKMLLSIQQQDAVWWRNACLLYFQTFSRQPLPAGAEQPDHTLAYYENLQLYYAPGTANSGVPQKTNP